MTSRPQTFSFQGAQGVIDCALDWPQDTVRGWALALHPHPLFGGARGNKVVTTVSRACVQAGLVTVRPDFRGVGKSAGSFDHGNGETDDMLALIAQFREHFPELADTPFVLSGFSFGSAVASQVYARRAEVTPDFQVSALVLIGTAVERFTVASVPGDTLVVHGEQDETVALAGVLDWARPQEVPVVVVPGATHFFHGKLVLLKQLVEAHLHHKLSP
nr:alpha/beta hydrolase [Pseudomonas sp.]